MILSLSSFIKLEILASACNFKLTLLHSIATCFPKSNLLSIVIPNETVGSKKSLSKKCGQILRPLFSIECILKSKALIC